MCDDSAACFETRSLHSSLFSAGGNKYRYFGFEFDVSIDLVFLSKRIPH